MKALNRQESKDSANTQSVPSHIRRWAVCAEYLHFILEDDNVWRVYAGKSFDVKYRILQHEKRDNWNVKLDFHHFARNNCNDHFYMLIAKVNDSHDLWLLRILKHLACLTCRTSQSSIIRQWSSDDYYPIFDYGLNIAPIFPQTQFSNEATLKASKNSLTRKCLEYLHNA